MKHQLIGAALVAAFCAAPYSATAETLQVEKTQAEAPAPEASGAPDGAAGLRSASWTPAATGTSAEWLHLSYDYSIYAASVQVHFTDTNGQVSGVEINGQHYDSTDLKAVATIDEAGRQTIEFLLPEEIAVEEVRLVFDSAKGTPSVDAVAIVNKYGEPVWASAAAASTRTDKDTSL